MSNGNTRTQRITREALLLGVLIVGILAARSTLADHYFVPSGSMEFTLIAGDRVFVDKRAYGIRLPFTTIRLGAGAPVERGDVVIFDSPLDGKRLIKRIVAVGGDEVRLEDGQLAINDDWLASGDDRSIEYFGDKRVRLNLDDGGGPSIHGVVEDGMVLAIGDHRGNSADGRVFGAVPESRIYGRAVAIYYRRGEGFGWTEL